MVKFDGFINRDSEEYSERKRLVDKLILIVNPRESYDFRNIEDYLFVVWRDVVKSYQVDHEERYVCQNDEFLPWIQEPWEDEIEDVRKADLFSSNWILDARKSFDVKLEIFYSIILDKNRYPKHYPNPNWTVKDLINRSIKEAVLDFNVTIDIQNRIFFL